MADKEATVAEPQEFQATITELSTDLILKTRQIFTIIESLPGVGVSSEAQLAKIESLQKELLEVQKQRKEAIDEKNELLDWCTELMNNVNESLMETAKFG